MPVALIAIGLASLGLGQEVLVKPGDTLWALAKRHNTTIADLIAVNDLSTTRLQPGMTLALPTGADTKPKTYTVSAGDTLYDIALVAGLSVDDLIAINDLDGSVIRPGQVLQLEVGTAKPEPLVVTVKPGDSLWALARDFDTTSAAIASANGLSAAGVIKPGQKLTIPGRYAGSAADQGGAAPPVITVAKGDSLWMIAKRYNTSVAALMTANKLSGTQVQVGQTLKIVPGDELVRAAPVESSPVPTGTAGMVWPLTGQVTSRFGYRRLNIGGSNMHTGLDIDGEVGDPIRSATDGVVVQSGWMGGYGNLVIVRSGDTEYYYAHASELLVGVGDLVTVGQVIAKVGVTGRVTGSHLHFEIRVNGTPVDPLPILEAQASH